MTLNYVTISATWNGRVYILAVDYDRYVIAKFCSFNSKVSARIVNVLNLRQCEPYKAFRPFLKLTMRFIIPMCTSVRPSMHNPHRTTGIRKEGFSKYFIFQNSSKNCAVCSCYAVH